MRTTEAIAKHANEIYTRTIYELVDKQLYQSGYFIIDQKPTANKFILIDRRQEEFGYRHDIVVELKGDNYISCSCGLFEHMGIICRHSLKVCKKFQKYSKIVVIRNIVGDIAIYCY